MLLGLCRQQESTALRLLLTTSPAARCAAAFSHSPGPPVQGPTVPPGGGGGMSSGERLLQNVSGLCQADSNQHSHPVSKVRMLPISKRRLPVNDINVCSKALEPAHKNTLRNYFKGHSGAHVPKILSSFKVRLLCLPGRPLEPGN